MGCATTTVPGLLQALLLLATVFNSLADEKITDVFTPEQFEAAMKHGAAHIRLRDHMDLRGLTLLPLCPGGECKQLLHFVIANTTESIQVGPPANVAAYL
jgi:hypothetical protein